MAKGYDAFETHLRNLPEDTVRLTYEQIREYSGLEKLPKSVFVHAPQYLSNSKSQPIPAAWLRAGWRKFNHNYDEQYIDLHRAVPLEVVTLADETGDDGVDNENRQLVNVKTRRGQPDFRERLRHVYSDTCAITGSIVVPLLEAAHIVPHAHKTDYATSNGLLLRADIHTLFDMHLIAIDPDGQVVVSGRLQGTEYAQYQFQRLKAFPETPDDQPSLENLKRHHDLFLARQEASPDQR
ncbi:HNH endonuclease [Burkholderia contaminans]|uniref:HNH endonuclease n=1 Tax=Burkholderia TaxID=32008 RepID=UPI0015898783|nr:MULTISPECIES: HNH endonuclease signature motif containing protein [Burkholderia]MBH9723589.1 HNH endonuclease [Burkholderia contaminans]